jgi:hypothetical protein
LPRLADKLIPIFRIFTGARISWYSYRIMTRPGPETSVLTASRNELIQLPEISF